MIILDLIKTSDRGFKKNLIMFSIAYFMAILNYPLIKASTTSLFFDAYGAKSAPSAWVWAILFLTVTIFICNKLQKKVSVQVVFSIVSVASAIIFAASELGIFASSKLFTYFSFIWKEIYIVIQVHLLLGYANNFLQKKDFKILLGFLGASGSAGGVVGGLLTTYLSTNSGTLVVLQVGIIFVLIPAILFMGTEKIIAIEQKQESPLSTLNTPNIRKYVFYIAGIVALTQFIINIADFRFNMAFEAAVQSADLRTSYLGNIFTWTNALTFMFQVFLLPFILPRVKEKNLHLFIPLSYTVCLGILMAGSEVAIFTMASVFIYLKACDYSLFSGAKEILYQPLEGKQKYGAKYLTDMIVYRLSKALIALTLIYIQSSLMLNMMMGAFLMLWLFTVVRLFKLHQRLFS